MSDVTFLIYFAIVAALVLAAFITVAVIIVKLCKPDNKNQSSQQQPTQSNTPAQQQPTQSNTPAQQQPAQPSTPAQQQPTQSNTPAQQQPAQPSTPAQQQPAQPSTPAQQQSQQQPSNPPQQPTQPVKTAKDVDIEINDEITRDSTMIGKSKAEIEQKYKDLWKAKTSEPINQAAMNATVDALAEVLKRTKSKTNP